jgi:hypothetical protein
VSVASLTVQNSELSPSSLQVRTKRVSRLKSMYSVCMLSAQCKRYSADHSVYLRDIFTQDLSAQSHDLRHLV